MCTIGAVSNVSPKGERLGFLFKTIDGELTETTHGIGYFSNNQKALFTSVMKQPGMNIGLNGVGLGVTISYSDCWKPGDQCVTPKLESDTRALANAGMLAHCTSVEEGLQYLQKFVKDHPNQVGGNHLLIDQTGKIALLEQYKGKTEHQYYTEQGFVGRGNNSHWLIHREQCGLWPPIDSIPREKTTCDFLGKLHGEISEGISNVETVDAIKSHLSSHVGNGDQAGTICTHGLEAPGARLFGDISCHTLTAAILEVSSGIMHFSLGYPCSGIWRSIQLL